MAKEDRWYPQLKTVLVTDPSWFQDQVARRHSERPVTTGWSLLSPATSWSDTKGTGDRKAEDQATDEAEEFAQLFDRLHLATARYGDGTNPGAKDGQPHLSLANPATLSLFTGHFGVTKLAAEEIWHLADLDRDRLLNKAEFCLASKLAHFHGCLGLSLTNAVSATAAYINRNLRKLPHIPSPVFEPFLSSTGDCLEEPGSRFRRCSDKSIQVCMTGTTTSTDQAAPSTSPVRSRQQELLSSSPLATPPRSVPVPMVARVDSTTGESITATLRLSPTSRGDQMAAWMPSTSASSLCDSSTPGVPDSSAPSRLGPSSTPATVAPAQCSARAHRRHSNRADSDHTDPIHLLSMATGLPRDRLDDCSGRHRCSLLTSLVREAKSVNHSLLRLNNELQAEWTELFDQRVNLSMLLHHLGLQGAASPT